MECCKDDNCFEIDLNTIDELIYACKFKIADLSSQEMQVLFYAEGCFPREKINLGKKVQCYLTILERVWKQVYYSAKLCLCPKEIQSVIEATKGLVDVSCCNRGREDCLFDESEMAQYVIDNPACQSYANWNKWTKYFCGEIEFKIEIEERACDIMFAIAKDVLPCNVLFALQVKKQMCDLGFKVNRSEDECKLDWKILVEETKCDIDFTTYYRLTCCGFSYDIVKSIIDTGCTIEVIGDGDCDIEITTIMGNYNVCDLVPENIQELEKYGKKITVTLDSLKSDYGK